MKYRPWIQAAPKNRRGHLVQYYHADVSSSFYGEIMYCLSVMEYDRKISNDGMEHKEKAL